MSSSANIIILLVLLACSVRAQGPAFAGPFETGRLCSPPLNEASGLVMTTGPTSLLWAINDSGDSSFVYGFMQNGTLVKRLYIPNATNRDWEDLAYGPGPDAKHRYFYIAEIGDNNAKASSVVIYRVPVDEDPIPSQYSAATRTCAFTRDTSEAATRFEFVYPDGARDAETLLLDPLTLDIYIVTKRERASRVYRAPFPQHSNSIDTLQFVTTLPFYLATGGDVSHNGQEVLIKNYTHVYHWTRQGAEPLSETLRRQPEQVTYMPEPQGEAIAWNADDTGYYTTSEQEDSATFPPRIYFYTRVAYISAIAEMRDVKRPQISVLPVDGAPRKFVIRYSITDQANVHLSILNAFVFKVRDVGQASTEGGLMEQEVDLSDQAPGTYIAVLEAGQYYASVPFTIR
ncbi:MAG: hypothetical protein JSS89_04425 [Bacteroidetes bacterium]|nr:hypothetical protein [Bacteroidota bacterium]